MGRRRRRREPERGLADELGESLAEIALSGPLGLGAVGLLAIIGGVWLGGQTDGLWGKISRQIAPFFWGIGAVLCGLALLWWMLRRARSRSAAILPPTGSTARAADTPSRASGTNRRALGTNLRALGTNPRALGTNPCALGTNPRALGTHPRAVGQRVASPTDGRAFEKLIAQLFRGLGYSVIETGRHGDGTDGGVDLVCRVPASFAQSPSTVTERRAELRADLGAEVLIQCKDYAKGWVSVDQVRAFYGAVCGWPSSPTRGIFIATCYFSEDAQEFAARNNLECLDGPALAIILKEHALPLPEGIITEHLKAPGPRLRNNFYARLAAAQSPPAAPPRVLPIPYCPKCGVLMVRKSPKKGETWRAFYGCANFPKCYEKVSIT